MEEDIAMPIIDKESLKIIEYLLGVFDYVTFNQNGDPLGKSRIDTPFGYVYVSYYYDENHLQINTEKKVLFSEGWTKLSSMDNMPVSPDDINAVVKQVVMKTWNEWSKE